MLKHLSQNISNSCENQRTVKKASVIVMLAWIVSALLSTPSAIYRNIKEDHMTSIKTCYYRYTDVKNLDHIAIVVCRFIFGFVIPFLLIVTCYAVIIRKLKTNQMAKSKKLFRIMTVMAALIVTFFLCWLPYQTLLYGCRASTHIWPSSGAVVKKLMQFHN
uniref:G-protein coupled receptors family 1 profile domain-containing protein n=1 Tax=Electrophorus electricus TaxID=8005 RepID=A0A4W4DZG0_ELEEL